VTTPEALPDALPQTRGAWAADRLRSAILLAELEPGEEIREARLAKEWGISPTPLREALRALVAEGLVVHRPQKSARVAELSRTECVEVYEIRLVLEPLALHLSLRCRAPERLDELDSALAQIAETVQRMPFDRRLFERAHRGFHRALVADCGSATLLAQLEALWDRSLRFRYVAQTGASPDLVYEEHAQLLEACRGGDPAEACAGLDRHIFRVLTEVLSEDELDRVRRLRSTLPDLTEDLVQAGLIVAPRSRSRRA
jgi:DNA-binding GntR family transcriptional regulator